MKKISILLLALLVLSVRVFSVDFEKADNMHIHQDYLELKDYLEDELKKSKDSKEQANILWRLSHVYLAIGDEQANDDAKYPFYEKGESLAKKSLEKYPTGHAYLWRASNIGRIGELNGPLNSLVKAYYMRKYLDKVMNEFGLKDSEVYYVLGELYRQLPGFPISYGDTNKAISYSRLALLTIPSVVVFPNHYFQLARLLYDRNYSKSDRAYRYKKLLKSYKKATTESDKASYYEAVLNEKSSSQFYNGKLQNISDREEALLVLEYGFEKFKEASWISDSDKEKIKKLKEYYDSIK